MVNKTKSKSKNIVNGGLQVFLGRCVESGKVSTSKRLWIPVEVEAVRLLASEVAHSFQSHILARAESINILFVASLQERNSSFFEIRLLCLVAALSVSLQKHHPGISRQRQHNLAVFPPQLLGRPKHTFLC